MADISISIEYTDNMKKYAVGLEKLCSGSNMAVVGDIVAEHTNKFVPKLSGDLRSSYVTNATKNRCVVDWNTLPYAQYQFYGRVMGPNKATWAQGPNKNGAAGVHYGWVSPTKTKYLTSRMMGKKADIHLKDGRIIHIRGYTTRGTGPKWTERALKDNKTSYLMRQQAGRYLYEAYCLSVGQKPVFGWQIMGKYT